jgi:hypothetical protein
MCSERGETSGGAPLLRRAALSTNRPTDEDVLFTVAGNGLLVTVALRLVLATRKKWNRCSSMSCYPWWCWLAPRCPLASESSGGLHSALAWAMTALKEKSSKGSQAADYAARCARGLGCSAL